MENLHVSKGVEDFLNYLRDIEKKYNMAQAEEEAANKETQDLLHYIELKDHGYHEYAKMCRDLKMVRQHRRDAKDVMEETVPVLDWLERNKETVKALERLLGEIRKVERRTDNRIYIPRTDVVEKYQNG